jgi:Protein of unknown function (DUF1403)
MGFAHDSRRAFPRRTAARPRLGAPGRNSRALYFAGAALAALDSVARSEPLWTGAWRRRLALKSAPAVAQDLLARREDQSALRDAVALAKPGQDLGLAGKVYSAFRALCDRVDPFRSCGSPPSLPTCSRRWIRTGQGISPPRSGRRLGGRPAPVVAAAAGIRLRADAEPLALWAADAALAGSLNWPIPVPLLAAEVLRRSSGEGTAAQARRGRWGKLVALSTARAALSALDLAQDLARRAARLMDAAARQTEDGRASSLSD